MYHLELNLVNEETEEVIEGCQLLDGTETPERIGQAVQSAFRLLQNQGKWRK